MLILSIQWAFAYIHAYLLLRFVSSAAEPNDPLNIYTWDLKIMCGLFLAISSTTGPNGPNEPLDICSFKNGHVLCSCS